MKKTLLPIAIIAVISILVVALLGKTSDSPRDENPTKIGQVDSQNTESQDNENTQETQFVIGDIIQLSDRILTINSLQRNYVEKSSFPITPGDGQEFLIVNITQENNTDEAVSFNSYSFEIENSSGVRTTESYVGDLQDKINSGDLAPDGKITGNIGFKTKKGETNLRLIYKPNMFSDKEVVINLDKE